MRALQYFSCMVLTCCLMHSSLQAEIAQNPIISDSWVAPNVVFTLDDSRSMGVECIPVSLCKPRGFSNFFYFGSVPRVLSGSNLTNFQPSASENGFTLTYNVSYAMNGDEARFVLSAKIRSPDTNKAYYNPERRYQPWMKYDGTRYAAANPASVYYQMAASGPVAASGTLDLTVQKTLAGPFCRTESYCETTTETFYPAQYFRVNNVPRFGDIYYSVNFDQIVINTTSSFTKYPARTDCAASSCTQAEELQNFANWFQYHRTKFMAAKAAIAEGFQSFAGETRLGYGRLQKDASSIDGESTTTLVRGVRPFSGTEKRDFYTWMQNLQPQIATGTLMQRAFRDVGNYYMRTDSTGPWGLTPGTTTTDPPVICRRALHMTITDGEWTDTGTLTGAKSAPGGSAAPTTSLTGNYDGDFNKPFYDANSQTLADVAMYYSKTNLRSDVTGSLTGVPVDANLNARGRTVTWPHMVNYTIALGVTGTLPNATEAQKAATIAALTNGTEVWPVPTDEAKKMDDLWHAALNSGGEHYSAQDPAALLASLKDVISSMQRGTSSDAPIVMPSRFMGSSYTYIPSYITREWSGDLQAFEFDPTTGDRRKEANGIDYRAPVWSASDQLSRRSAANRAIYTWVPGDASASNFTYSALSTGRTDSQIASLLGETDSTQVQDLINYLRGDQSVETAAGRYRIRSAGILGDIVNSNPVWVLSAEDNAYDFLPATQADARGSYRTFLSYKKKRQGQVFVGANDGMLHAFNAQDGSETFAYIPKTVLGSIQSLKASPLTHRYFVDGPLVEVDVFDNGITDTDNAKRWRNVVIGTGGAGGRNIFAINIPVQANGVATTAYPPGATDILWEKNNSDTDFSGLGHVLQKPAVGLMRDGRWVVIVGNGYVNSGGTAKLIIMNALTGAHIKTIDLPSTGNNGLGGVRLVLDQQRQIAAAYAGDLQGNLWKFDFSSTDPTQWRLAFSGTNPATASIAPNATPFYVAKDANDNVQPITAAPTYLAHPKGGYLVVFGTGKFYEQSDATSTNIQAVYAIWDTKAIDVATDSAADAIGSGSSGSNAATASSKLVEQVVSKASGLVNGQQYFTATNSAVDYDSKRGWFIRLNIRPNGLRLISTPQLAVGKLFVQTVSPNVDEANPCAPRQGKTVNFILNAFTGSNSAATFDVDANGRIDSSDAVVNRSAFNAVAVETNDTGSSVFSQKMGSGISVGAMSNASGQTMVAGDKKALRRTWRQIIRRPTP